MPPWPLPHSAVWLAFFKTNPDKQRGALTSLLHQDKGTINHWDVFLPLPSCLVILFSGKVPQQPIYLKRFEISKQLPAWKNTK